MKETLTNTYVDDFLQEFENESVTKIYEEGEEKAEIIKIAKEKMRIDLVNNSDLAGFKTIYTFGDRANGNKGRVPQHLLLQAMPTLIGKPVNINHIRHMVVGYYIDFKYIQSEQKMIAYGIFFKSNFADEWFEAKQLFESGKLGTSHEIWCPKKFRRYLSDGTYEMTKVEFAGGALIYRNRQDPQDPSQMMQTAYENCDVLEVAMKKIQSSDKEGDLLFASLNKKIEKYNNVDLLMANQEFFQRNEQEIKNIADNLHAPTIPKVKCANCDFEFETTDVGELKCPECKSIIARSGEVLYPPQKFDFSFTDPEDSNSVLLLIENNEEFAIAKNRETGIVYKLTFKTAVENDQLLDNIDFIYVGQATCPQCRHNITISTSSAVRLFEVECPSCNLKFHKNLEKARMKRKIVRYENITEEYKKRKTEEGDKLKMVEPTPNLVMASLIEESSLNLEVANLTNLPTEQEVPKLVNLETASLGYCKEVLNLEVANLNMNSKDKPTINVRIDLEVASLEATVNLEIAHVVCEESSTVNLEVASLTNIPVSENGNIKKYKKAIRTMSLKLRELSKRKNLDTANLKSANELEIAKINKNADEKIGFYKNNAVEINKRREFLGDFATDLSDTKIVDDSVYAQCKLEKENALLKANLMSDDTNVIGDENSVLGDNSRLQKLHDKINADAFSATANKNKKR